MQQMFARPRAGCKFPAGLRQSPPERKYKLGSRDLGGPTSAEVILAGEKYPHERDYYLERREFERMVDPYRHGPKKGSNYLFVDGHVEPQMPREVMGGIDPWDVVPR